MLTSLKDSEGKIIAYVEWRLVGPSGFECETAEHVWVNDCWIHKDYRGRGKLERLIDEIMRIVPNANYCYFQRKAKNERVRIYSRRFWERRRNAYDPEMIKEN